MSTRELTILTDVSMITCVVQREKADAVIAAAQEVGAQGATVHFGSGTGLRERLGLLGLAVDVEKEVITILCGDDQLDSIFEKMYFAGELDVPGEPDLEMLSRFSDIFRAPDRNQAVSVEEDDLLRLVDKAGSGVRAMREAEGLRLASDLDDRLRAIESGLDDVEQRAPERLSEQRNKLRRAVQELSAQVEVDEDRLAREIAYLAEKWDINEEIVRFRSHIDLFRSALSGDASEPVGKRLGFLVQEMLREANTVASKANDSKLAQASVAIKEEIERIDEDKEAEHELTHAEAEQKLG